MRKGLPPMTAPTTNASKWLSALPPEWPEDPAVGLPEKVRAVGRKIVVLDDDPTGTQTVHGIPVLTTWSVDALTAELASALPGFYVLTNSRSLDAPSAAELNREIGRHLRQAAEAAGVDLEVVSRSDSTLRGHFPEEVDALAAALGTPDLPCLIMPFFFEGGRLTIDNIHYVLEDDRLVPASETAYAGDPVFGYRHSDLRRWVEEKTRGRVRFDQVASISLEDLRCGGPQRIARQLADLAAGDYCVVDAVSYRDMAVLVDGLLDAEVAGCRFIFRTAASFVRVRAGIVPRGVVDRRELTAANAHGGLFVVGSYVPKTTEQLNVLRDETDIKAVALSVADLLDKRRRTEAIECAGESVNRYIGSGEDVVLFTSRELVRGDDEDSSLAIGRRVSESLIRIVRRIDCQPRYLVAKGGITSSDVATSGLDVKRAMIMGQVLPGVPAWKLGQESRYPGMAYIVFPGNVGDRGALAEIQRRLARKGSDQC